MVLKLGGELLETASGLARLAGAARSLVEVRPLVVVHGAGRAIDAELDRRGIVPRKVDGLRVTDAPTLEAVVAVLAGSANTDLVVALTGAGVPAVGLTGADAGFGRARRANTHRTAAGHEVDLGLVGDPIAVDPALLETLLARGYVPVVASLGIDDREPSVLLNVNADVMAGRIAAALDGAELVIAGATAGAFDADGRTIAQLDEDAIDAMIAAGTATAGMIAKLTACRAALAGGVRSVRIVDGRTLAAGTGIEHAPGTEIVRNTA